MAAQPNTEPTFARLAVLKAAQIIDGLAEQRFQRKHGSDDMRREQMLERLGTLPGGDALLARAERIGAPIRVKSHRKMNGSFGVAAKDSRDKVVGATVSNTGDPIAMARTAYHELRHVVQIDDMGLAETGGGRKLRDVRTGHMISMMMEADAFTAEALAALKAARNGQPEYVAELFSDADQGPNIKHVRQFLKARPFDSFDSDEKFARALFTDLMLNSLDNYGVGYFGNYREQFIYCSTLDRFKEFVDAQATMKNVTPSETLSSIYGTDFINGAAFAAITTVFRASLPKDERDMLKLMESTVDKRHSFTEEQYQQRRREIIDKSYDIYMKEYLNINRPGTAHNIREKFIQAAAEACTPPKREDYRAAIKAAPKKPAKANAFRVG